ncbi:MAG TPA: hypothetical protein VGF95_08560 [Solirubrobacteraceae bacterium]|jgi:hypothetical protein
MSAGVAGAAEVEATPENPLKGWVSQGGNEVPLGYTGGACAGVWHPGELCADLVVIGLDAEPIALLTPGTVHLRVSAPVTFTKVDQVVTGDGPNKGSTIEGRVHQTSPTEADVVFDEELVPTMTLPAELVGIGVLYEGAKYGFAFKVEPGLTVESARLRGDMMTVKAGAAEAGGLDVVVEGGKGARLARWAIAVRHAPSKITIKRRLRASARGHEHYRVRVTLRNKWGHASAGSEVIDDRLSR